MSRTALQIGEHVKVRLGVRCTHLDLEPAGTLGDGDLCQPVAVVREEVSEESHGAPVGIASEDVETAQARPGRPADEDPIAAEKEALTEASRDERGTKPLGLDECDRREAAVIEGVEDEARWEHGLQQVTWEGVGQDEAVPEVRDDR